MAKNTGNWEDIGRNVKEIVDRAVGTQDYQKLNQTIWQVVDRAVDLGGEAVRKVVDNAGVRTQTEPIAEKKDMSIYYGSTGGKTALSIAKIVGGGLLGTVGFGLFIASTVVDLFLKASGAVVFAFSAPVLTGAGVLIASGLAGLNRIKRFKRYRGLLGEKTHIALERLARSVGKSEKFVRREIKKMITQGYYPQGHLDREETRLIISEETYQLFEKSRLQLEQRQLEAKQLQQAERERKAASSRLPQVQEVLDKGDAFLAEIRRCNDIIPGFEISEKIYRMETIVQRIFERAEAHPEIIPDLKKMMDYYLPMTVKLLNAYADMDAQPVQGQTIQSSKREIEATLDTLNLAFEKLLDSVFEDTALDVSSDISVLQTLLAQEGLTEDGLSQIKKQRRGETL